MVMSIWGDLTGGALGVYGYDKLMDNLSDSQDNVNTGLDTMQSEIKDMTGFKPWGVYSDLGYGDMTESGLDMETNAWQQGQSGMQSQNAYNMFNQASRDPRERQNQMFQQMQAARQPELRKGYNALQNNVYGGGTGGMQTTEYGGNPEQYAFGRAMADSQSSDMLTAQQMAQGEQAQTLKGAQQQFDNQFTAGQHLTDQMTPGINNQQMNNDMTREQASLWAQLGMGGLSANTNFENIRGGAFGDMISATMPMAQGAGNAFGDMLGSGWNWLTGGGGNTSAGVPADTSGGANFPDIPQYDVGAEAP
jgi:hypothetical protein